MKKLSLACAGLGCFLVCGCAELSSLLPQLRPQSSGGLTTDEMIRGLKEALTIGAANSSQSASKTDGFYRNLQIFIPFPPEAIAVKNRLEQAGFSSLIREFELSINRAAEEAAKTALPVFKDAVTGMTIPDALGILRGAENAATTYLRGKTEPQLLAGFTPVVRNAIQTVNVTRYWSPVATTYNNLIKITGGTAVNPNLEQYITQKALDGLFFLIAQEEAKIRRDPVARVTEILKRVFGAK